MDACIFTISVLLYLDDFFYSLITGFLDSLQSLLAGGLGGSAVELSVICDAGEGTFTYLYAVLVLGKEYYLL